MGLPPYFSLFAGHWGYRGEENGRGTGSISAGRTNNSLGPCGEYFLQLGGACAMVGGSVFILQVIGWTQGVQV